MFLAALAAVTLACAQPNPRDVPATSKETPTRQPADPPANREADAEEVEQLFQAGVKAARNGSTDHALDYFRRTVELDPKHANAHFNIGILLYRKKQFAEALEAWKKADRLEPDGFHIAVKLVQGYYAVGDIENANRARESMLKIWKASSDEEVRKIKRVVIDNFEVDRAQVAVSVVLEPDLTASLYYHYTFHVSLDDDGREQRFTVQLESSAFGREMGVPYLLGVTTAKRHATFGPRYTELPAYQELKPHAVTRIEYELATERE